MIIINKITNTFQLIKILRSSMIKNIFTRVPSIENFEDLKFNYLNK